MNPAYGDCLGPFSWWTRVSDVRVIGSSSLPSALPETPTDRVLPQDTQLFRSQHGHHAGHSPNLASLRPYINTI